MSKTKTYSLSGISEATWRKLRVRALREGLTVKALFMRWIQQYAEGK